MFRKLLVSIVAVCCLLLLAAPILTVSAEGAGLAWLAVRNGIFSPVFSPERSTYYAILENEVDTFEAAGVDIRPVDPEAIVNLICLGGLNEDGTLPEGRRVTWLLSVTEPGGKTSRCYLKLYRKAAYTAPIDTAHQLAEIVINGGAVEVPHFSGIKAYYDVVVPADVQELTIQAYPADRSKMAMVVNAPAIMPDEPVCVSILVKSSSGDENVSIYTLRLTRESFAKTPVYTRLQLWAAVLAAFAAGAGLAAGAILHICRQRRTKEVQHEASS